MKIRFEVSEIIEAKYPGAEIVVTYVGQAEITEEAAVILWANQSVSDDESKRLDIPDRDAQINWNHSQDMGKFLAFLRNAAHDEAYRQAQNAEKIRVENENYRLSRNEFSEVFPDNGRFY